MPGGLRQSPGGDGCGICGASRSCVAGALSRRLFPYRTAAKGRMHTNKGKAALNSTADGCPEKPQKALARSPVILQHNYGLINQCNYQAHTIKTIFCIYPKIYTFSQFLCLQKPELWENKSICHQASLLAVNGLETITFSFQTSIISSTPVNSTAPGCNATTTIPCCSHFCKRWKSPFLKLWAIGFDCQVPQICSIQILAECLCRDLCHSLERTWLFTWGPLGSGSHLLVSLSFPSERCIDVSWPHLSHETCSRNFHGQSWSLWSHIPSYFSWGWHLLNYKGTVMEHNCYWVSPGIGLLVYSRLMSWLHLFNFINIEK